MAAPDFSHATRKLRRLLLALLRMSALALVLLWSAFPIALIVLGSVRPAAQIFAEKNLFAFSATTQNYVNLWKRWPDFFHNLANSLLIALGATALTLVVSFLAGYVYARRQGRWLTASAFFMILVRLLPPIVLTLPLFPAVNWLMLNDTRTVLIVLYCAFFVSLGTWIMKAFIDQLPLELEEAAAIDGSTLWQTLWHIILPLSHAGLIATSVFIMVFAWNDFLFAFIFTAVDAKTAPVVISEMVGAIDGVDWGILFAAATCQLLPILVFVLLVQKYLIAGLSAGAAKG
ncbi:MAG: carbohydrate ABC transporter permease [Rhodoferax sp.]|nr:carbohydrate ABC transporter permease [Rhodoferax sp.]